MFKKLFHRKSALETATDAVRSAGFSHPEMMLDWLRPGVSLVGGTDRLGASRIGGTPDLPSSLNWPKGPNGSMVFFAQIDLTDVAHVLPESPLPADGWLYFFIDFPPPENEFGAAYDFHPGRESYRVLYAHASSALEACVFPPDLPEVYHFRGSPQRCSLDYYLPDGESWVWQRTPLAARDQEVLMDFVDEARHGDLIMGWPYPLQSDPAFYWACSDFGLSFPLSEDQKVQANAESSNYIPLLSLDMLPFEAIGDSQLFFGIHRDALRTLNFDQTVLIMQGT